MFLTGLGTFCPPNRFTQIECWAALQDAPQFSKLTARSRAILRKVLLGQSGIESRQLAYEQLSEAFELNPDALHARFARHAPLLAAGAAERALADAGRAPRDIDAILISTCTGYLCPGLTSYVSERLGLRPDALMLDLVGQGCGAALPNLRTSQALIQSGKCTCVLSVCVEVCSAAFCLDDDPGVLISACLFGDGAAAAVLDREAAPLKRRVEWVDAESVLAPAERESLRFEHHGGMLRNILSPEVPAMAAKHAKSVLESLLARHEINPSEISGWILHAGGKNVLTALRNSLALTHANVRGSSDILRDFGNLSSPFVLFVLQSALLKGTPGGRWWMASFGAGFSSHGALLRVD